MLLSEIKDIVHERLVKKQILLDSITKLEKKQKKYKRKFLRRLKALELVKDVALLTQQQLEYHLSDMVSAGLNTVFDDSYDFVVKFERRRGKTECDLFFKKGEELVDPLRFSGGGACDVAAFALRCASWSMTKQYRNTLILDEPFSRLKGKEENQRAIQLMKTLSKQLKLQIICINDERISRDMIIEEADRVFEVTQVKYKEWKKSKVTQL